LLDENPNVSNVSNSPVVSNPSSASSAPGSTSTTNLITKPTTLPTNKIDPSAKPDIVARQRSNSNRSSNSTIAFNSVNSLSKETSGDALVNKENNPSESLASAKQVSSPQSPSPNAKLPPIRHPKTKLIMKNLQNKQQQKQLIENQQQQQQNSIEQIQMQLINASLKANNANSSNSSLNQEANEPAIDVKNKEKSKVMDISNKDPHGIGINQANNIINIISKAQVNRRNLVRIRRILKFYQCIKSFGPSKTQ
jgi:hypothetical protein